MLISGKRTGRANKLGQWLLAGSIAGSALSIGAVHTATLCIVTCVLGVAAVLVWWTTEPMTTRPDATLLLGTGIALTLYTALQCVPLPLGWLAHLAPHNADVWSRALSPMHEPGPRFAPLSLDPIATRVEVLRGVAYLLAFVASLRIARQREGARLLAGTIVVVGLVLAASALLHPAFGAHKLFGVYEPAQQVSERHIAPLMNPNNLAGYLNIALCLALAMAVAPEPIVPRSIAGAVVLVLGATQLWVASRAGIVTMILGALSVLITGHVGRSRDPAGTRIAVLTVVTAVCAAAGTTLIVLGASEDAATELFDTDVSKAALFLRVMRMLPAVSFFGCGRGAFESAFPAFQTLHGYVALAYPENVFAQWVLEWGLPVGLAGMVTIAFALRPSAVLPRSSTASGAWAALVAVGVQNLGDFGSEIPGVMLACVACAGIVLAGTPGHRLRRRIERWARRPRRVALAAAIATALSVPVALVGLGRELGDDQRSLYEQALIHNGSLEQIQGAARAAMLRHPAEPYLPFVVSLHALGTASAVPWVGATLERAPIYGPAHMVLARTILARAPAQARTEYRLALEQAPELDGTMMSEIPRLVRGFDDAMELVPQSAEGERVLERLSTAVADRLPSTQRRLDAEIVARAPDAPGPVLRAARDVVDDIEAGEAAPWCANEERPNCGRRAIELTNRATDVARTECGPFALRARVRIALGDRARGLSELAAAVDAMPDRVGCLQVLADLARQAGDLERTRSTLDLIIKAGCLDDAQCARQLAWVASRQEAGGNPSTALGLYQRAYERAPDDDAILEHVARLSAEMGLHVQAAEAFSHLAQRHPADARWPSAANEQHQAAIREALKL